MQTTHISNLTALSLFMLFNGVVAYYLWRVFKKNLAKRKTPLSVFNVIIVFLPMLAFSFEFVYFLVQIIKSIFDPN